jgi:hypothetical protein
MGDGIHEGLTPNSLRTSYGCVDWFPYYRHEPITPPGGARPPDSPAVPGAGRAGRLTAPNAQGGGVAPPTAASR